MFRPLSLCLVSLLSLGGLRAEAQSSDANVVEDRSVMDPDGTAHLTRVVPVPYTISPEARRSLAKHVTDPPPGETLEAKRHRTDAYHRSDSDVYRALYPSNITQATIAGVPVRVITPTSGVPVDRADRILINLHGGGFTTDSGSLTESIPIAGLTRIKVIAVLYRLAPEHPFPDAVNDAVAVYREVLKSYRPEHIAIYGASAGAILTGELAIKLKTLGLPLPAGLGLFSTTGDLSSYGDTQAVYTVTGVAGRLTVPDRQRQFLSEYVGSANPRDPILSPLYADLKGLPPTLFLSSTRDMMLSSTTVLHRAFLRSGVDAQLIVFEALNHGFWYEASLPETKEANQSIASFFLKCLGLHS
ncbi:alpha/beta hydrolase fold domain-containing protein [Edaphobacter modestus]|uniref:Acetyl esterase/lipase n=1 Tax=Edaphobacter modestus TaxID=388466 RepID=A0A4Q7YXE3_9BACT|nr:alpha/beta hydrolase fold domain-containing protein [Edaphobacter modestus]RZU42398.1 acetyl esterase/lipase [Edaphobacter modestus]